MKISEKIQALPVIAAFTPPFSDFSRNLRSDFLHLAIGRLGFSVRH